jgi:uncharacterized heparinase superfamily protein
MARHLSMDDPLRLARTVLHLRPMQPVHRVRLRTQRVLLRRFGAAAARRLESADLGAAGWPEGFVPLDATLTWPAPEQLAQGRLQLLGADEDLGFPFDWRPAAPQLWTFHLHYWDWAWGLAAEPDDRSRQLFHDLVTSWVEANPLGGRGDAWSPYVVSLRAWSWCGQYAALVAGTDLEATFLGQLRLHLGFIRHHLELDVGGNHLLKNLKALIGLGVFLRDEQAVASGLRRLVRELAVQVLPDGGHVERAPAYHCQVLGDLIDLSGLLGEESPRELTETVAAMRRWLGTVLLPDGTVPLLNDGFPVPAEVVTALCPGPAAPDGLTLLPDSGLAVARRGATFLLADVGLPCPDDLPAHAHADTLGFLLHSARGPLVAERFTTTYAAGDRRDQERGTAAHSTVQVDGEDSTEVWGGFRAGRRARPRLEKALDDGVRIVVRASHDGYRHLPGSPRHRRTWEITAGTVRIVDTLDGGGDHAVEVRLHVTPAAVVRCEIGGFEEIDSDRAVGWMRSRPTSVLVHRDQATLPWRFEYELETGPRP